MQRLRKITGRVKEMRLTEGVRRAMNRKDDHNSGMNKRGRKTGRRILTGVLALAMVLTQQSEFAGILSVRAGQKEEACKITGFVPLSANVREQRVSVGTKIGDLSLPDTLEAYVLVEDAENEWGGGRIS